MIKDICHHILKFQHYILTISSWRKVCEHSLLNRRKKTLENYVFYSIGLRRTYLVNISPVFKYFFSVFDQWYFLWPFQILDSYLEYFVLHRPKIAEISDQIGENYWKLPRFTLMHCNAVIWPKSQSFSKIFSQIVTKDMVFNLSKFEHHKVNISSVGDF